MEKQEGNDNIYVYPEKNEIDTSAPNFSQIDNYVLEEEESDDEQHKEEKRGPSPFLLLLMVLLNPVNGWKSVRRNKLSPELVQRNCFYPLIALMSVSKFAILFYSPVKNISEVLVDAVTSFVSFFFGYFCILILLKMIMTKDVAKVFDTDFGKVFVGLSLSSICLFFAVMELLPMLWAVLIFLPLWTVYLICRGTRFFKFPEQRQILYTGLMCLIIVGVPIVIDWGLMQILPV